MSMQLVFIYSAFERDQTQLAEIRDYHNGLSAGFKLEPWLLVAALQQSTPFVINRFESRQEQGSNFPSQLKCP